MTKLHFSLSETTSILFDEFVFETGKLLNIGDLYDSPFYLCVGNKIIVECDDVAELYDVVSNTFNESNISQPDYGLICDRFKLITHRVYDLKKIYSVNYIGRYGSKPTYGVLFMDQVAQLVN